MSDYEIKILDTEQLYFSVVDPDTGRLWDRNIEKRLRFFDRKYDLNSIHHDDDFVFFTAFDGDKIIAIAKIGYYSTTDSDPQHRVLAYITIDREYRGLKLTRVLVTELVRYCKKYKFSISASSWTVVGYAKLRPLMIEICKKYKVKYKDHKRLIDSESEYDDNMTHIHDMTPQEVDVFNKARGKYQTSFFKKFIKNNK